MKATSKRPRARKAIKWKARALAAEAREAELRGEVSALEHVNARERNDRKAAEKRAREAEARADAWKEHAVREESLASASDTCRAELEAELREVEAETIATVVAWLRDQRQKTMTMPVSDAREAEDAKLVCGILGDSADAIARGDWSRDCGARRGEKEASDGE